MGALKNTFEGHLVIVVNITLVVDLDLFLKLNTAYKCLA